MSHRIPRRLRCLPVLLLLVWAACARGVAVETEPTPTYAVQVSNPFDRDMIVSYDDGTGARILGTVLAGGEERFIIANPDRTTVQIRATDEDRTRTVEKTITLRAGETVAVSLSS